MVSRLTLIFWRWVVVFHDRLHTARDKAIGEAFQEKYGLLGNLDVSDDFSPLGGSDHRDKDNVTYTSPSVHYQGVNRRKDD